MCKQFEIARNIVESFINKHESFSFNDVKNLIIEKGGVLRISPDVTVSEFLTNLEEREIIYYNSYIDQYDFFDSLPV